MLDRGVRLSPNGRWHMASTHPDEDVDETIAAARDVLYSM